MKTLTENIKNLFHTELTFPPNINNSYVLGFFSKKLPYPFNFETLNSLRFFRFFFPKQIHSTKIVEVNSQMLTNSFFKIEGDAVFTFEKDIFLGVRTADCVPILITNKNADFVGVIHAGWRGSVNRITYKFLQKIISLGIKSEEISMAIGPHIKSCCYEVGEEVVEKLKINFEDFKKFLIFKNGKTFLDLEKLNYYQALELSIPVNNIWISEECTCCLNDYYWSHRVHKEKRGFQISVIGKLI